MIKRISVLFLLMPAALMAQPKLTLAPYICDSVVLQRDAPIIINGTAGRNSTISIEFANNKYYAQSDSLGRWSSTLPPMAVSRENRTMNVSCEDEQITVRGILIGDVWFAGGQSNMGFKVSGLVPGDREMLMKNANDTLLRCYIRASVVGGGKKLDRPDVVWNSAVGSTINNWSAVSYLFGKGIYDSYDIPVGIITCAHGGSTAEAWISPQAYEQDELLRNSIGKYHTGIHALYRDPSTLYNAMLAMFEGVSVKGVIWYQAEANALMNEKYYKTFTSLIDDWRRFFRNPKLPFIFAQLPSYGPTNDPTHLKWAEQRWVQYNVWRDTPHTCMVVTAEYGDPDDIHPRNKIPVGARFVSAAKADVYGENIKWHVNLPAKARRVGKNIYIDISDTHGGLSMKNKSAQIEVCGADGVFHPASSRVKGSSIEVRCRNVSDPVSVRYAWRNVCALSFYDTAGIPVPPFVLTIEN